MYDVFEIYNNVVARLKVDARLTRYRELMSKFEPEIYDMELFILNLNSVKSDIKSGRIQRPSSEQTLIDAIVNEFVANATQPPAMAWLEHEHSKR